MRDFKRVILQFYQASAQLRRAFSVNQRREFVFHTYSMYDYHNVRYSLVDLCRKCETTNRTSATRNNGNQPVTSFHCEFTDYLRCMEQYSESYCHTVAESRNDSIAAALIVNLKRLHVGSYTITGSFFRLMRVDPHQRRKKVGTYLLGMAIEHSQQNGADYHIGYALSTNVGSMGLIKKLPEQVCMNWCPTDIFVIPTESNNKVTQWHKLTQKETERLWMVDLIDWSNRPILSDLRSVMQMKEYLGTFAVGDFPTGRYAVASVWQPSSLILCDDRLNMKNVYRGPYWLVSNLFQSTTATPYSNDEKRMLLSALNSEAANNGIPFILYQIEQSSPFNAFVQKQAVAVTTEFVAQINYSSRMATIKNDSGKLPTWLDPRDFSGLLYFNPMSGKDSSHI